MSVEYLTSPYVQSDGTIIKFCVADTEQERPSLPAGSLCFTKDSDKLWITNATNQWQEAGGVGAHPDLGDHNTLGLATQTELDDGLATKADSHSHPYSSDSHNHDAAYSATGHSHGGGGGEAFPVGSIYINVGSTNPATLLGYGTWTAFGAGRVLVGLDATQAEFDTALETGGAKTHTLTQAEMPNHTHPQMRHGTTTGSLQGITTAPDTSSSNPNIMGPDTGGAGSGGAHNNLQPYIVVYMWRRTA